MLSFTAKNKKIGKNSENSSNNAWNYNGTNGNLNNNNKNNSIAVRLVTEFKNNNKDIYDKYRGCVSSILYM